MTMTSKGTVIFPSEGFLIRSAIYVEWSMIKQGWKIFPDHTHVTGNYFDTVRIFFFFWILSIKYYTSLCRQLKSHSLESVIIVINWQDNISWDSMDIKEGNMYNRQTASQPLSNGSCVVHEHVGFQIMIRYSLLHRSHIK